MTEHEYTVPLDKAVEFVDWVEEQNIECSLVGIGVSPSPASELREAANMYAAILEVQTMMNDPNAQRADRGLTPFKVRMSADNCMLATLKFGKGIE